MVRFVKNYTMLFSLAIAVFAAPAMALSNARSSSMTTVFEEDEEESGFVQVGRVGATPAPAAAPVVMTPDGMDIDYPVAQGGQPTGPYSGQYIFPANTMTGQLARFILAAGFLFAEMMLIFGVLALLEYFLIWWKPHSFEHDLQGRMTTRPANPANRMGSLLTTPNLHQRVEEHNQERIRLLEESQKVQSYDGKEDTAAVLKESPACAA